MATTSLDISKYTTKFTEYPVDFKDECKKNNVKLPGIDSLAGQAYALMAQPEIRGTKHLGRNEADKFFEQIGMETKDSIQPFNKTSQKGLVRLDLPNGYCLAYPFQFDMTTVNKRTDTVISGDRDAQINAVKDWYRKNLLDIPNDKWQEGHLDPTIGDASENNLAYQPPIQKVYKNKFKWDKIFFKMWPTAEKELIPKIDKYYTEKEQKLLLAHLKAKWE